MRTVAAGDVKGLEQLWKEAVAEFYPEAEMEARTERRADQSANYPEERIDELLKLKM